MYCMVMDVLYYSKYQFSSENAGKLWKFYIL